MPISGSSPRLWQRTEAETRRGGGASGRGPSWVAGREAGQRWRIGRRRRHQWRRNKEGGGEGGHGGSIDERGRGQGRRREEGGNGGGGSRATSFEAMEVLADAEITHKRTSGRRRKRSKEEREEAATVSTTTQEEADGGGEGEKAAIVDDAEVERERSDVERTQRREGEWGRKGGGGGPTMRTGRKRERGRWVDGASAQRGGDKKEGRGGGRRSTMTMREEGEHGRHQEEKQ